jgi:hypothetical protein
MSNYAMERSGNGWRVRAASAPEIIARVARAYRGLLIADVRRQ